MFGSDARKKRLAACAVLVPLLVLACSRGGPAAAKADKARAGSANETTRSQQLTRYARLLAGIDDRAAASDPLRATDAFRAHAHEMSALWNAYTENEASGIRPWVQQNLAPLQDAQTLIYTFAGADFLFAHAFFPRAHTYVLVGLERIGALRDLDAVKPKDVEAEFARVRKTVAPLLQTTFFKTLEMQEDSFQDGLMTILATLIAGTGHRLVDIQSIAISKDGRVETRDAADGTSTPGARIEFTEDGSAEVRTLYYFRADLSDKGLAKQGGVVPFIESLPSKVAFAKAAAYCMHRPEFSVIRNTLLRTCSAVLEDDTGIPLRYFDRTAWDVRYFGSYSLPITMFKNYRQTDLAQAFATGKDVSPLTFHVGYGTSQASNLMLALKKKSAGN